MKASAHSSMEDQTRQLEQALREKEAALRELQHRAKNSLQLVISLLKLQSGRLRDPEARAAYELTLQRIEALAIAYRHLHESGQETQVDLGRYLEELTKTTCAAAAANADVGLVVEVEAIVGGLSLAVPLGLILNELVTSALKHAYPPGGRVRVTLSRSDANTAELVVADNGRGLPPGFDSDTDAAMMLAEALAGQLGATFIADVTSTGPEVKVIFPI